MSGITEQGDLLKRLAHEAAQSDTLTRFYINLLWSDRLQLIAICCKRRGCEQHTSHVTFTF